MTTNNITLNNIRQKYGQLYNLDLIFDDDSRMTLCKDLIIKDKQDILDLLPNLTDIVLSGAPTFLHPLTVIISIFPSEGIINLRKIVLYAFPHFSQEVPWLPHIYIKDAKDEEEKIKIINELKKSPHQYTIKRFMIVES